jgi:hypothetical protein
MKTLTNTATAKLAQLLSGLPEIQKIISDENERETGKAIQARMDCINLLTDAHARQVETQAVKDAAFSKLEAARAAAKAKEPAAFAAASAFDEADRRVQHLTRQLYQDHGEGRIHQALYLLDRLAVSSRERLAILEGALYKYFRLADGYIFSKKERPEIKAKIQTEKDSLAAIANATEGMKMLLLCRAAPDEIATNVTELMDSAGYRPNAEPTLPVI